MSPATSVDIDVLHRGFDPAGATSMGSSYADDARMVDVDHACRQDALWEIGCLLAAAEDRRCCPGANASSITIAEPDDRNAIERPTVMAVGGG